MLQFFFLEDEHTVSNELTSIARPLLSTLILPTLDRGMWTALLLLHQQPSADPDGVHCLVDVVQVNNWHVRRSHRVARRWPQVLLDP